MVKIMNHVHKFNDKDKLLAMCVAYIETIEKLTDIERLQDDTTKMRRQALLLKPLLKSLRLLTHPNFPLNEII